MRPQTRPVLGEKLGEGGEGRVFALAADAEHVAKIYLEPLQGNAASKLEAMVNFCPGPLAVHSAWPLSLLRGKDGRIDGLIMPKAHEPFDIHEIYSPRDRTRILPDADWGFLVRVAANTAVAFAAAHAAGIVVGDVNHGSVRVGRDAKVRLIDCDSMQFSVGDTVYRCAVGMDTYTPPELHALRLADVDRTQDHDAFGLAVMIFQLLFLGRHPFSGVPVKAGAPTDIAGAIAEHAYAYLDPPGLLKPPPAAPPLSLVSEEIRALFLRAFQPASKAGSTLRPTAREWVSALTVMAGSLQTCSHSKAHVYRTGLASCPWCAFERVGVAAFVDALPASLSPSRFDPSALMRISQRLVVEAARTKRLGAWKGTPAVLPPGRAKHLKTLANLRGYLGWPALIFSVLACFMITSWAFLAVLFVIFLVLGANESLFHERRRRVAKLAGEQAALIGQLANNTYDEAISVAAFIDRARAGATQLLKQAQEGSGRQTASPRETQLRAYLDTFRISPGCVHGIGQGRVAQLASFGIETAADVDVMQIEMVPGFGDQLTERVIKWRKDLEKRFKFNPKSNANGSRRGKGMSGFSPEEVRYFMAISAIDVQMRRVTALNDTLETRRAAIEPKIAAVSEELEMLHEELRCLG